MKVRTIGVAAILLAVGIGLLLPETNILEVQDTVKFKVEQIGTFPVKLKLSGLGSKKFLSVKKISEERSGNSIQVLVRLKSTEDEGAHGDFDYTCSVPNDINSVTFGKDKIVVWDREKGVRPIAIGFSPIK
ncbi:MAG: hypothetical protein PHW76_07130 [Alphaproteobacteria bacterium]|nr:hypothetical protein [Alphaproteobacteria bacterium]